MEQPGRSLLPDGRAAEVEIADEAGPLAAQPVTRAEAGRGVYLSWRVSGPVTLRVRKTAGFNAVASGLFVDPS